MTVSKKKRFEVFKRDKFTCQYCGAKAPDVVLHCDHIEPKSKGGSDDIMNLVTSCQPCNSGKGARKLDDSAVVERRRTEAEAAQDRTEQIEMMAQWARGMMDLNDQAVTQAEAVWCDASGWEGLTDHGRNKLQKVINKFGLSEVLRAMTTAHTAYDDPEEGFNKIGGICRIAQLERDNPNAAYARHALAIMNKKGIYVDHKRLDEVADAVEELGADEVKRCAAMARNWSDFWSRLDALHED